MEKQKKMLSKALQKRILSLDNKKQRKESGLFVAEGGKTVIDLLAAGLKADKLIATVAWLEEHHIEPGIEVIEVSNDEMKRISFQQTPQGVMGIFRQPRHQADFSLPESELCLALDNVQDPGNMGAIMRTALAFGYENIVISTVVQ